VLGTEFQSFSGKTKQNGCNNGPRLGLCLSRMWRILLFHAFPFDSAAEAKMFRFLALTAFSVLLLVPTAVVVAQGEVAQGDIVVAPQAKPAKDDKPKTHPQAKSSESKPDDSKPTEEKSPEKSDSPPPKVIRRDELQSEPSNAAELQQAVLGDDGKVSFEFRNQTWTELIQWLSALSAITLRHIASLLTEERSAASREALAPEFKLRHLPAEEAKRMLEQFLGIEKKKETPMTPQEMQMMQQMRQQQGGQPPTPEAKKPEISVVANNRQNSIIIMAPADRVAIATEFLKRVDVPSSSINSLADVQNRVQVFRLASLDPEKLIEIIQEMNILEPTTRTRVDAENRAVIVSGSAADRYIIDQLIKRLDGTGRQFEVLQLRRLDAGEVAESIAFLMGQDKEEDDSSSNRRYSYFYGMSQPETKKKEDKFRVAANTRFRQVLLWANEPEMAEVRNLLVKLGELPPPGGDSRTIRMIDASPTPQTLDYLKRLKEQWEQISPNPIELPDADSFADPLRQEPVEELSDEPAVDGNRAIPAEPPQKEEKPKGKSNERDTVAIEPNPATLELTLVQTDQATESMVFPPIETADEFDRAFGRQQTSGRQQNGAPETREKTAATPIRIEVDPSGNLLLSSRDTEALDRLENLMLQFAPPKRPYLVFKIKHASASWMRLNLEDYFKDLDDEKLSVGVDEISNTLLVSAEGEPLLDLVCDMIKQLDLASRPSGDVQVVKLSGGISSQSLEAALRAFSTAKATEANRDAGRAARPGNADNVDPAISP